MLLRNRFHRLILRAYADASGGLAVFAALTLTVLLVLIGASIDMGRVYSARAMLQLAADAAALTAAADPNLSNDFVTTKATASVDMNAKKGVFNSALQTSVKRTTGTTPEVEVHIAGNVNTTLARLVGVKSVPVAVSAKAGASVLYGAVYALVDMSGSMGLAANPAERAKFEALTSPYTWGGCLFACHWREGWEPNGQSTYQMARNAGIMLREDVLMSAFGIFVDNYLDPTDPAVAAGQRTIGVYGFSDTAQLLRAPSNVAASIKSAPSAFPDGQRWNTVYASLSSILSDLGPQGKGTPADPIKTILLISDGVGWRRNSYDTSGNGPIDQTVCDNFKSAGYTVAVLEVQYQDASGEYWFDTQVKPFYPQVSPRLQACASPGYYFLATDSDAQSLADAFATAASTLRSQLVLKE